MRKIDDTTVEFDDTDAVLPQFDARTNCCGTPLQFTADADGRLHGSEHRVELTYDPGTRRLTMTPLYPDQTLEVTRRDGTDVYDVLIKIITDDMAAAPPTGLLAALLGDPSSGSLPGGMVIIGLPGGPLDDPLDRLPFGSL